jgi:hypothetical protein
VQSTLPGKTTIRQPTKDFVGRFGLDIYLAFRGVFKKQQLNYIPSQAIDLSKKCHVPILCCTIGANSLKFSNGSVTDAGAPTKQY